MIATIYHDRNIQIVVSLTERAEKLYGRSVGRKMKMMCCAQSQCSQGERKHISNMVGCQWYNLPSFPVPTVGCNQRVPFSTLAAALAASHPLELEVQDAEALELH